MPDSYDPENRPPIDAQDEEVYFEGSPLLRGEIGMTVLLVVLAVLVFLLPALAWFFAWGWPWWTGVITTLIAAGLFLLPRVITKTRRYRISNFRIDYERGVLSKTIDTLELWHVDDVRFEQSLLDRMLGVATLTVISDDATTPRLELRGLPKPRPLFDTLKQRIITVKRQRGVIKMDMGGGGGGLRG